MMIRQDVSIRYRRVTDGRTNRQTDRIPTSLGLSRVSITVLMRDKKELESEVSCDRPTAHHITEVIAPNHTD